ncbi:MAG: hypothetical protein EU539_07980 [Promethearchaeota archaeon]|nr:MAG: hypothetical protein EU539_07980 [Candidatus Lokiarchaeota archaeon]
MPNKIVVFFKRVIKLWFVILIIIILILVLYEQIIAAIVITIIGIALLILSYIPSIILKVRILRFMKEYYRVEDRTMAKYLNKPLRKIQNYMFKMSQNQVNKDWVIIFLEKHYIFYHSESVNKIVELYTQGYDLKEMLEELKEYEIKTRVEIKTILDTLIKYNRLEERKISVKERREKKRFESI